jgi:hypothetical protein
MPRIPLERSQTEAPLATASDFSLLDRLDGAWMGSSVSNSGGLSRQSSHLGNHATRWPGFGQGSAVDVRSWLSSQSIVQHNATILLCLRKVFWRNNS